MTDKENDVERFIRIRDEQLESRDPQKGIRKTHDGIASKHQRIKGGEKKVTILDMVTDVPHKLRGTLIGAGIGLIVFIVLPLFIFEEWVNTLGLASVFILAILGFIIGQAFDTRDNLRDMVDK